MSEVSAARAEVLGDLLELLVAVRPRERAIVGIDGPDGVGKSTLAAELRTIAPLVAGREVIGVSVDGFHFPRAVRYAHGRDADAYYDHAFDYDALRRHVLLPFRAGREIVPAIHDVTTDQPLTPDPVEANDDALLLLEGVFLQRPELDGLLDAVLLVTADLEVSVPRGNARFALPPEQDDPDHPANARYVGAQRRYAHELRTRSVFPTWILDNTDLDRPRLLEPDVEAGRRTRGYTADGPYVDWDPDA